MKISCLPVSLFEDFLTGKRSLIDWIQTGSKIGLNGIDISTIMVKNHTPLYINQIKSKLKKYKIPIIMYSTYPDFTNPEKLQRDRELEYLRSDIALASNLKAKYIRLVAGQAYPEVSVKKGIKWVLENFKIAEEIGNKYKISLVFENHSKPNVWKFADFSHPTEIFLEIAEKLKDTSIKINFDTANTIAYGDEPLPILKKVIDNVATIHASDTSTKRKLTPVLLGNGLVPFKDIFRYLKLKRFKGWISIEEASNNGLKGIKDALAFVKKTWEES